MPLALRIFRKISARGAVTGALETTFKSDTARRGNISPLIYFPSLALTARELRDIITAVAAGSLTFCEK